MAYTDISLDPLDQQDCVLPRCVMLKPVDVT